jgi:phosphatidylserine/phosphatidylglycerophosphate/cardiolipin synthase-like enzyme
MAIYERFRRPQGSIYIVSPYLQDYAFLGTSPLSTLLLSHLASGAEVTLLTTPPPGSPEKATAKEKFRLLKQLNDRGVRVLVNNDLHAKIYLFEESSVTKSVILGSANMTTPAMERLLEIALVSYNHELYSGVNRIVARFEHDTRTVPLVRWATVTGLTP